jgi:glycosyltransferase involved in cell wall biosynthesis
MRQLLSKGLTSLRERGVRNTLERAAKYFKAGPRRRAERIAAKRYAEWIRRFDTLDEVTREEINRRLRTFEYQPLISVLMPVYNSPEVFLRRAIESVQAQVYPHWELCVADDASTEKQVRRILEDYAARDSRIKLVLRKENGHISAASNSALSLATGDFIALLDHDDELHELALYYVALELNSYSEADLLYSDEDSIDEQGTRLSPHFKSDWNPDLFLSQNYINHLGVYRTEIVRYLGGFREGFEGSQDYDLALRVIERIPESHIRHIPHVLYHWRAIPGSVSLGPAEKSYTIAAAHRALVSHLERTGKKGEVLDQGNHMYRVKYDLPAELPKVNIIAYVPHLDEGSGEDLRRLISNTRYPNFEIKVLSPSSGDDEALWFRVVSPEQSVPIQKGELIERGAEARSLNEAARKSEGELLLFLDAEFSPENDDWLCEMVRHALRPEIGAVGAKLLDAEGRILHAGLLLAVGESKSQIARSAFYGLKETDPQVICFGRSQLVQNFSAVTKSCLMIRGELFSELAGFDETNTPNFFYDIDLCLRLSEIGLRVLFTPYATLRRRSRKEPTSMSCVRPNQPGRTEIDYIANRWGSRLRNDPYYNPNLNLTRGCYEIGVPKQSEEIPR